MNPPPQFPGDGGGGHRDYQQQQQQPLPSPPKRELQGPRPSPLKVSKDSHKIRKPPPHPPLRQPPVPVAPYAAEGIHHLPLQRQEPVIIYTVSPKVIHATVSDFMSVVQRLTGPSTSASPSGAGTGDLSPAARLASIEKTSPSDRERPSGSGGGGGGGGDFMGMDMFNEGIELCQFPGILSPAPATLPSIPPGFFPTASDPQTLSMLHDLSPFWHSNSFMASPSALLSAPLISPSPSSMDILNNFLDF